MQDEPITNVAPDDDVPPGGSHRRLTVAGDGLGRVVDWAEVVVATVLALVIFIAVAIVLLTTMRTLADVPWGSGLGAIMRSIDSGMLASVIKTVLDVFIVIELFRITQAYVRHSQIITTVLETALVVAAREVVVIEAGAKDPMAALAVSGTLIAVGLTWWLLHRSGVTSHG